MGWGIVDECDWVFIKIVGDLAQTFQVSGVPPQLLRVKSSKKLIFFCRSDHKNTVL